MRKLVPLSLVAVALMAAQCTNQAGTANVETEATVNSDQHATTSTDTEGYAMLMYGTSSSSSEKPGGTTHGSSSGDAMMYAGDSMKIEGRGEAMDGAISAGGSVGTPPVQATTSASGSYNYSK